MRTCPTCHGPMSLPVRSPRTGCYTQTCRNFETCGLTIHSTTPDEPPAPTFVARARTQAHGQMFLPSTTDREPPPVKVSQSAFARFEKAHVGGTVKRAIRANDRQLRDAAAVDGKARQVGEA